MGGYLEYPEYKDSRVEWLGKIPAHWTCGVKLIYLAAMHRHSFVNGPFGSDLLTSELTNEGVPVIYSGDVKPGRFFRKSDKYVTPEKAKQLNFCRVDPGDLLLAKVGDPPGDAAMYPENAPSGIVTQDVVRVKIEPKEAFPSYVCYFMNSKAGHYIVRQISVEATRGRFSLGDFKSIRIFMPPLAEQESIARFLDYKTAQIDALIAKKENLLAKLAEKRTALISQAVTKGLDPTVPMKDSGIEWLGDIPAHWVVSRAKFVANIFVPQRNKPDLNEEEGLPWLTMDDMTNDRISTTSFRVSQEAAIKAGSRVLKKGAVIASCVGNFGVAAINDVDVIINQQLQAYIPKQIIPEYLRAIVSISGDYFKMIATAATIVYVNQIGFGNLPVVVPPTDEQQQIVDECQRIKEISRNKFTH